MREKHNKLYYEQGRNGYTMSDTINPNMNDIKRKVSPVPKEQTTSVSLGKVNPKMKLSKDELLKEKLESKLEEGETLLFRGSKEDAGVWDDRVPSYYRGKNGYEARRVIDNFDLSYNVGTATTYLLRCGKKKEEGMTDTEKHIEDIQKAINHLQFEIERLKE